MTLAEARVDAADHFARQTFGERLAVKADGVTYRTRGEGTFHVRFDHGELQILPTPAQDAEAYIDCSYDNLYDMGRGFVTMEKLYLNGQLRFSGNLSKGFEIRRLLFPTQSR